MWDNESTLKIWIWCLLRANYKSRKVTIGNQVVDLEPGQFITGRYAAGEELKMNPNTFWKRVKTLEKLEMIELKSNNKYTVVSVINWASYQISSEKVTAEEQQSNNKVTTKEQQSNTDNKVNKDKKDKKVNKEPKIKHGEYGHVLLTEIQLNKLITDFGQEKITEYIKRADEYTQQTGKKYSDYNLTIRNWIGKEGKDGGQLKPNTSAYNFDSEAI